MSAIPVIVASFLKELLKCIAPPIKRQLNYLCCFSSNIQDFGGDKKKLVDVKDGLQMRVNAALNNAEIIVPEVETWLKDADEIQEKIIGIESEITNIQGGSCLAVRSRYSLSKKIKKTTEAMKKLRDNCKFDPIAEPPPPPAVAAVQLGSMNNFQSRRQIEDDIMTCLKAGKVNMLGICGMGGIGKTTMAKRVMNKAREYNLFDEIVIAVVSQTADMSKVQKEIAESLGLKLEDETLSARAHKLRIRLIGGKRILIVLDDVWMSLNLEDLGIPRESGSKGCIILLTSRDKDVLNEMEAHKIFGISTLSNEEAWSLFREKAGACAHDPNLLSIAQEIVQECKGLPIAIVNVAAALKDKKQKYIWDDARQQLRSSNPVDMPKVIKHVYKHLKLSYSFLESENAQSIFLLCCLFPEDSRIPIEDLATYVWGLRKFEGNMDLEKVRNMTYSLVEMLKSRFLLLKDDDEDYLRMHDVVRDVAIFIASKEKKLIKCGANSTWLSPSLGQRMEEISNGIDFQNLRLLMTDGSVSDISFERMKYLNVLSMRSVPSLPRTTQLLKSLRTLILEDCFTLNSISGIGELVDLEILICCNLKIEELPVEMSRLVRLMKLEISFCWELRTIAPNIISRLVALKELEILHSFEEWEANGIESEHAALSELGCLSSLTCLSIHIGDPTLAAQHMVLPVDQLVKYHIVIGCTTYECFPSLRLQFEKTMCMNLLGQITSLGNWVLKCISRVEYLLLEGEGSNIVDLGQTQNMRMLIFRDCSTTRKLVNISIGSTTVFSYQEWLKLVGLRNLEEICHIDGSEEKVIRFPQLKRLILMDLARLSSFSKGIERIEFPQLTDMTIHNCPLLRNATGDINNYDGCFHWFCNQEKVMLKNLELVNSRNNTALRKLWCHQIPLNSFNGLETLYITNFSSMRSLFSSSTARNLGNLKTLRIHDCEEMVNVVDNEEICEETSGLVFPRLQQLEMWGLHKLEMFCRYSLELPLLRDLHILDCSNLERFSLGSLTTPNLEVFKVGFRNITIKPGQDLNVAPHEPPLLEAKEEEHSFFNWVLKIKGMERLSELALYLTTHPLKLEIEDYTLAAEQINFPSDIILSYHITIGHVSDQFSSTDRVYQWSTDRSMRLHLPISDEITLGNWVHQCVRNVEYMCLEGEGSNKVDLRQAQNMRRLTLKNSSTLTKLVNIIATSPIDDDDDDGGNSSSTATTTRVFPHLEYLNLVNLPNLEEIFPVDDDSPVPASIINNVFNNLKELHLRDLPRLKHFWNSSNANSCLLQQLQELRITECPMMEQVFLWENQGNDKGEAESKITITFPELKSLELKGLPMLTTLCKGIESIEFPQLTDMVIHNWPQLNNLFCQQKKVAIGGLKDLRIWRNETISNSSSLWCDQIPTHGFFTGLEKLDIGEFSNLRSLFSCSIASNLNNLRDLQVSGCEEMVKVIEDDAASCELSTIRLFPLLQHLELWRLPKLEIFCEWRSCVDVELPSLETVEIYYCPKMESFNLGSLITPNLEKIKIGGKYVINTKDLNFILQQQVSRVEEVEDTKTTSGGEIVEEEEN